MGIARIGRIGALLLGLAAGPVASAGAKSPDEDFETRVRPVLAERCWKCHGPAKQSGGLRLDSREAMIEGGENGPAIAPGEPDRSLLVRAVRHEGDLHMPPKGKLGEPEVQAFAAWIRAGASWPSGDIVADAREDAARSHWAFRPVVKPAEPAVKDRSRVASPVDAFLLSAIEAKGLTPSPRADRRTLLRRVTFDLIGLPPTEAESAAFEADRSPDAFAKVVDRLLASPHYGERWGRHWLDVARYADTKGYVFKEERRYPYSYTYRDYVIRAFNDDLPYDRFLLQQIAADRLPEADPGSLAAMGFLTVGRRFLNNGQDIVDDRIDVVCRGLLGLTVACARCHDHKYDPIPTEDYYSLHGVFASSVEPGDPPEIPTTGPNPRLDDYRTQFDARRREVADFLRSKREEIRDDLRKNLVAYLTAAAEMDFRPSRDVLDRVARDAKVSPQRLRWFAERWRRHLEATRGGHDPLFAPWHALAALPAGDFATKAAELVKGIAGGSDPAKPVNPRIAGALAESPPSSMADVARRYGEVLARAEDGPADADRDTLLQFLASADGPLSVPEGEIERALNRAEKDRRTALEKKVAELNVTHPGAPPRAMVLRDAEHPQDSPVFLRGNPDRPGKPAPRRFLKVLSGPDRRPFRDGSGRLELAREIVRPENPLTARVMVNRIWMHHFGAGLVATPGDFGLRGEPPSHPELLDFLAARFVESGWSIKAMHRLILLSNAYQQRSDDRPDVREIDPRNRLVWRQNRRRLEFEAMRDAILAVSGALDPTIGGRPVEVHGASTSPRRTVYAFIDRQNLDGLFRAFDFASPDASTPRRHSTVVPQQALFLMNSPFLAEQSRRLAGRPEVATPPEPEARIRRLYDLTLGRSPDPRELALGLAFLDAQAGAPAPPPESGWSHGFGAIDEAAGRVVEFRPLPHWSGSSWQLGPDLPHPEGGYLHLSAVGGHPGLDPRHSAIRRWIAPRDATIAVEGALGRESDRGDGVRGRVVSGRSGILATWTVHHGQIATPVARVEVRQGETIDFVLDCLGDDSFDTFTWAPSIRVLDGAPGRAAWSATADFSGPLPDPLNPLERFAQVLLMTNEFLYVD